MRLIVMLGICLTLVSACTKSASFVGAQSPLVYDASAVARADTIAIMVPGALAPIEIFEPAQAWRDAGYALVYYRFPGMDGLPLDHVLGIETAAGQIAEFANSYPEKRIRLLGYSTGGPIVILAAQEIAASDVRVAAMSSAVERAGGMQTAVSAAYDVLSAAVRIRSTTRERVWIEYYRTLLFGRKGLNDPARADEIERLVEQEKDRIIVPDGAMSKAHSGDLRKWNLPQGLQADLDRVRFFVGLEDPVFSTAQTREFARTIGGPAIVGYPGQGHLLFLTRPDVFDDIFKFFEGAST